MLTSISIIREYKIENYEMNIGRTDMCDSYGISVFYRCPHVKTPYYNATNILQINCKDLKEANEQFEVLQREWETIEALGRITDQEMITKMALKERCSLDVITY